MNWNRLQEANRRAKKIFQKYHEGINPDNPDKLERYASKFINKNDILNKHNIGIYRKTKVFCSSPFCCGNERRIRGGVHLTRQELLAQIDEKEQLGI